MKTKPPFIKGKLSESEQQELERLGLKSFVHEYARLRKMAGAEDFSSNQTAYSLLRAQLAATIRAIGIMDRAFEESGGRNAYSYVAVHGLARELSHDLRAFGDQSETAERVRKDVVQTMLQLLATEIVSSLIKSRKYLRTRLPPKTAKAVDEELRHYQEGLTSTFANADIRSSEMLGKVLNVKL